jgi:hypothetical protein
MTTRTGLPVLGIRLTLTATAEGGRGTPLHGGSDPSARLGYRPNWGLPGWRDGRQTAAPVLGFTSVDIRPGDSTSAVIVAWFADEVPEWWYVEPGEVLRMYEGRRVCGTATVLWTDHTQSISDISEQERLLERIVM